MLKSRQLSAEAVYAQCLRHARIHERASRREAQEGRALQALVFAWGADISLIQTSLFERVVIARRAPIRVYFTEAEALVRALGGVEVDHAGDASAADLQLRIREQLFNALPLGAAVDITGRFPDVTYLAGLRAPTAHELSTCGHDRLEGAKPEDFAAARHHESDALMVSALSVGARGESRLAIEQAYASDFRALEAYLVDSALAVGDRALLTVELRWELVRCAMADVPGLPAELLPAVAVIREAMCAGLGEPDCVRLLAGLADVGLTPSEA
ncbi:MAG: hypothetical protein PHU75_01870 [Candidatus Nanopelagicales bacterium]|nr:hypothetical protein [Candidatus Nanopelagicales bacterium]